MTKAHKPVGGDTPIYKTMASNWVYFTERELAKDPDNERLKVRLETYRDVLAAITDQASDDALKSTPVGAEDMAHD